MKTLGQGWLAIDTRSGPFFNGTSLRQIRTTRVIVRPGRFDIDMIANALEQMSCA
jgi:hypothetical protein